MILIFAQIIGFAAVGLYLLSYQLKKRVHIVWVTFFSNIFYVSQYLLLGAFSGAVMDILSTVASFLAAKKNAPRFKKYAKWVATATIVVILGIGLILAYIQRDYIELLPPIARAVFQTISKACVSEPTAVWTGKFPPHLRRVTRQHDYMTFVPRRRYNNNLSRLNCTHFWREKGRATLGMEGAGLLT